MKRGPVVRTVVVLALLGTGVETCAVAGGAAREHFYALTMDGKRVGYGHSESTAAPGGGVKVVSDVLIKVGVLGTPLDIRYQAVGEYAADGVTPVRFAETVTRGTNATTVQCVFHGGTVDWTQTVGGQSTKRTIALAPHTLLVEGNLVDTWQGVFQRRPHSRSTFKAALFEPLMGVNQSYTFTAQPARTETLNGTPTPCTVWTIGPKTGGPTFAVRRGTGEILTFRIPDQKAVFQRADKSALRDVQNFDLTSRAFATTDVPLPPTGLTSVTLKATARVSGEAISTASLQHPPFQTFRGTVKDGAADGTFTLRALRYDGAHAPKFPYTASTVGAQKSWLKPDGFSESDDPAIRKLAAQLTAGSRTGWEAASRIGHWVFANITYTITGASARQCLASKTGDCGPHTNLTVALCRAAGIPARMTGGALYTPLLGGSYGQHYWTRVWMGPRDGWVPLDSTTGEIGTFGPTHLTLWDSGAMGALSVKVIGYAPKPTLAAPVAQTTRTANGLTPGYTETYRFTADDKPVGTQTATLTGAEDGAQTWTFALHLDVPKAGQTIPITETGTARVTDRGQPKSLAVDISAAGTKQALAVNFGGAQAMVKVTLGDSTFPRPLSVTPDQFLGLGNVLTFWSLALRATPRPAGQTLTLPFFMAESLLPLTATLTPTGAETLTLDGKTVPCQRYDVAPLGEQFWLDAAGALVKVTDAKQKLVIVRTGP